MSTKHPRSWKLFDDGTSAVKNGTPFRVSYSLNNKEIHLYFSSRKEAFIFVQDNPEIEKPEIKNEATCELLYPPETV